MRSRISRLLWNVLGESIPVRPGAQETIPAETPPLELSGRDYAIALLRLAAEIEHGLMVQYLFSAYSLDPAGASSDERRQMVRGWQETILGIAKEEMAHLVTVQNLLTALGGPLQFNREDFPDDENVLYPSGFRLRPMSPESLATYVVAESPKVWDDDEARRIKQQADAEVGGPVNRVGRLYEELVTIISDEELVPDSTFDEDSGRFQASWDEWGRGYSRGARGRQGPNDPEAVPELVIMTAGSRDEALEALALVGEQGEGFELPEEEDESHFERFLKIHTELEGLSEDDRKAVVRDVASNPTTDLDGPDVGPDPSDADKTSPISNHTARVWAHLFNVRYRKLLINLAHAFELAEDRADPNSPGPRGSLIHRAFGEMYNLRAIAGLLVALPLDHAEPDGARAGPPFQMPYTLMLPHDEDDRWRLHRDLLDASATLAERIRGVDGGGPALDYLSALSNADRIEGDQLRVLIAGPTPTP